jgi:hypothetical protein
VKWYKFVGVFSLVFLAGCVSTLYETRTVEPDGTYTVEATEITEPVGGVVVGEPWVGVNTPWVYYNDGWYWNGVLYGCYGSLGWWPWGYYPNNYIVQNNVWYNNSWNNFYRNNPQYYHDFHNRYQGGRRYDGPVRNPHDRYHAGQRDRAPKYDRQRGHQRSGGGTWGAGRQQRSPSSGVRHGGSTSRPQSIQRGPSRSGGNVAAPARSSQSRPATRSAPAKSSSGARKK